MTIQEDAIGEITSFLEREAVPYMIIGGIANLIWGEPRATLDVDVTVLVPPGAVEDFIASVAREYTILVSDPEQFVRDTRVLPASSRSGVRIDLIFGLLPFEEEAVRRAASVEVAAGTIRVCSPEDLILMKIISERARDLDDARAITRRRLRTLDLLYLEPRIAEMSVLLENDDIAARWARWKAEAS
ncbi:MAG: nucleotidyltransferase [Acidobacteriota bacterium]|nr:nucleotidyltransferase [Acidobacteriota bacterium]